MTRELRDWMVVLCIAAAAGSIVPACSKPVGRTGDPESSGVAHFFLSEVPPDVHCVAVDAQGVRSVSKRFPVVPANSVTLELSGLSLGAVTFTGAAFPGSCDRSPSVVPSWVADPVSAVVAGGVVAHVTLIMHRDGRASIGIDFEDDGPGGNPGGGGAAGAAATGGSGGAGDPVDAGESADDAAVDGPGDAVIDAAVESVCNNGVLEPGETCDPPDGFTCGVDCQIISRCGNGVIDPGEDCDPPSGAPTVGVRYCDPTCHHTACGNNFIDPGEECDPPAEPLGVAPWCDALCRIPICGNGAVDLGEDCDPPNGTTCDRDCRTISSCVPDGASCDGVRSCCFGHACARGVCLDGPCQRMSSTCGTDVQCCAGLTCRQGQCVVFQCGTIGTPCDGTFGSCCFPFQCGPAHLCQPPGCGQGGCCQPPGTACVNITQAPCCSGRCSADGITCE